MENQEIKYSIGIDIGGTKCAVILGRGDLDTCGPEKAVIERTAFSTREAGGWKEVIKRLIHAVEQLLNKYALQTEQLAGIGISCGGPLDYRKGIILNPPNLCGWDNVPIVSLLKEHFHVPVSLENDANACAVAEWRFGVARGKSNVIFLTFGTGLGAGLILDGRLYHGTSNMAGEVGHVRLSGMGPVGYGKAGSFEGFCSGGGIVQLARSRLLEELQLGHTKDIQRWQKEGELTTENLAAAARKGDPFARSVFDVSARYLGKGLAVLVDILNPEMIVIGSVYERCQDLFRERMRETLKREALSRACEACEVRAASLGDQVGDYAALAVAALAGKEWLMCHRRRKDDERL